MKALITGVSGQDGFWMAKLALGKGANVVGLTSRPDAVGQIETEIADGRFSAIAFDYGSRGAIDDVIALHRPDMFFNFAALATGSGMFSNPVMMSRINGEFVLDVLEAARTIHPKMRFCQASSAEMYGDSAADLLDERGPFAPKSPYGAAKLYAHNLVSIYRKAFGLHAVSAILFNHESIRRPLGFVTRKVANAAAQIKLGLNSELKLGSLDTKRDWGYAPEYAEAMYAMIGLPEADDYVLATGKHSTIRDLCEIAFGHVGLDFRDHVRVDNELARSIETKAVRACPDRAFQKLGWKANTALSDIIAEMVDHDLYNLSGSRSVNQSQNLRRAG